MRILGPVVQIAALPVFNIGKQRTLRRTRIAAALHQDIEYDPILVNGAPQEVQHAPDPNEHFIKVPFVARLGSPPAHLVCEAGTEFQTPLTDALVGDDPTPFRQQQFDIAETQTEYVVQPNRMADQLGREAVAIVRVGWLSHPAILARAAPASQTRLT